MNTPDDFSQYHAFARRRLAGGLTSIPRHRKLLLKNASEKSIFFLSSSPARDAVSG
jgi:hypothetical protein